MGLEVAEIAELAALTPIRTTAVGGALAAAARADDHDGAAAADTGCVTPTASRVRAMSWAADHDGAAADGIGCATATAGGPVEASAPQRGCSTDDTSYATPTACRTTPPLGDLEEGAPASDAVNFTTPTSDDSALRPATVCPPAPRKLPPALKRKLAPLQQRLFYPVPLDLATVFKPASPAPPPAAKKMRAHVVESSLPLGT
uniref:Uncharacterized protein n=1 Tax=Avena sativa TaxID=4498 RepID=A0ACD5Z857_AVESA